MDPGLLNWFTMSGVYNVTKNRLLTWANRYDLYKSFSQAQLKRASHILKQLLSNKQYSPTEHFVSARFVISNDTNVGFSRPVEKGFQLLHRIMGVPCVLFSAGAPDLPQLDDPCCARLRELTHQDKSEYPDVALLLRPTGSRADAVLWFIDMDRLKMANPEGAQAHEDYKKGKNDELFDSALEYFYLLADLATNECNLGGDCPLFTPQNSTSTITSASVEKET